MVKNLKQIQTSETTGVIYTQVTDEVMKTIRVEEATCSEEKKKRTDPWRTFRIKRKTNKTD